MPVKKFRPVTPTLRFKTVADFAEITRDQPEKSLLEPLRKTGGRNNRGRVTAFNRAFRRRFEVTPSEIRAGALTG